MAILTPAFDTAAPAVARFPALGSWIDVQATEPARLAALVAHCRACFDLVDQTFSRFRPDSELARLEQLPGLRQPASSLLLELLDLALRAAAATDGWFDPTIRDALEAAGYDRSIEQLEAAGPGPARAAAPAGRWREIAYDRDRRWVAIPRGVRLDFGGIGKGFAVDYTLRTLPAGFGGVLLNAGGDLAVTGPAPRVGWVCDIAATASEPAETAVTLAAGALATSGLGRRQWRRDGQSLHHLIDPHTGQPGASPWRYVTVAARDCAAAEVAAKVAWLRGAAGPRWLAGLGLPGRFVGADERVEVVGAWPESPRPTSGMVPMRAAPA
jgi:thiamine biosynthesis lipoprotein